MKTNQLIGAAAILLLSLSSCERNHKEEPVIETRNTNDHVNVNINPEESEVINEAKLEQERTEFRHKSELRIDENNRKIDELNKKAETADARMRKEYRQRIADLKERNAKARERLNGYKEKDKNKWEEFKREFNHDMDELGHSLEDFTIDNKK